MSVDPRYISERLKTQWAVDITKMVFDRGESAPSEPDQQTDFAQLLDLLLQQKAGESAPTGAPAASTDALAQLAAKYSAYMAPSSGPIENASADRAEVDRIIAAASGKFGVDPALVTAVVHAESGFRSDAVSSAGAKGLMQLMDGTARTLGVADSFNPVQNVNGGTRFLSFLLDKYNGNVGVALAAYNAGPGRVDRLGIRTDEELAAKLDTLPNETQHYVGKVLSLREHYK
ncbi:lytic transglycosylase domain-containing protein [Paenibacillus thermotolerans]|uniref:lytic transglycosylase domain-containing protein n=1 Tax=Paenibacillus thermotolerans TaxID=3027807 RepID=UPI002368D243|nr:MULTISPECIES: lytic transglycosylase domain-containing protein [unclassified Paenibacillus]